ncbi:hypothetical protein P9139_02510 [Curtobacterium flaccumfaciens]|nr:hypothetical protein P9139_02510 [Curtobacterium flaccumfaciens]
MHTTPRPHRTWAALGAAAVTALVLTACTDDGARTLRGTASATTARRPSRRPRRPDSSPQAVSRPTSPPASTPRGRWSAPATVSTP